ncbi:MAG TPA: hypothetical protein VNU68_22495, partial [Verrucomicrobiae bacterium]|nr:hypothetical protein [Verrucomicrobiae bacterium]
QPDESGSALGILVYNAQGFRRSDKNIARGLSPFDQSMIDEAGDGGKIELDGGTVLNVRRIEGKLWALKPRARRYAVAAIGQPAKILKRGKKPAAV